MGEAVEEDADGVVTRRRRTLEKPYRDWLMQYGSALNAEEFGKLSFEQRIEAVEKYKKVSREDAEAARLGILNMQNLLAQTNPYAAISESHFSQEDSEKARMASIQFYGLPGAKYCQMLGPQQEHSKVVNAYIWPRSSTRMLPLFGLKMEDIHNPRNILRLHQSIERAFDWRELAFIASDNDSFVVKVFCPGILSKQLKGVQQQFSDIDGKNLRIPNQESLPFRRLLAHHSVVAHRYAREKGWIGGDLSAEEFNAGALLEHSLDKEAQERVALLWKRDM